MQRVFVEDAADYLCVVEKNEKKNNWLKQNEKIS
jgi:hypothetical protein